MQVKQRPRGAEKVGSLEAIHVWPVRTQGTRAPQRKTVFRVRGDVKQTSLQRPRRRWGCQACLPLQRPMARGGATTSPYDSMIARGCHAPLSPASKVSRGCQVSLASGIHVIGEEEGDPKLPFSIRLVRAGAFRMDGGCQALGLLSGAQTRDEWHV